MTDATDLRRGQDAVDRMVDTWHDVGAGLVDIRAETPWLMVGRKGDTYTLFLALTDGRAIAIEEAGAEPSDLPDDVEDPDPLTDDQHDTLATAFENAVGGSYPLPDDGVFAIGYVDDDGDPRDLFVGLTDDHFEAVESA